VVDTDVLETCQLVPPSKLYCKVKPATAAGLLVIVSEVPQVLAATGADGVAGKITALPDALVQLVVPAGVPPQLASSDQRTCNSWQPVSLADSLVTDQVAPPSKLYCCVKPGTSAGGLLITSADPQVFDAVGVAGTAGKITALPDALAQLTLLAAVDPQAASFDQAIFIL